MFNILNMSPKQTAPRVELKKLQVFLRMSEETLAFAADVYVDGKKAGFAKNDGHGGCTMVHLDKSVAAVVGEYALTVVPEEFEASKRSLNPYVATEWLIDGMVEKHLAEKEAAKAAKKIAKIDQQFKTSCAARGTHAARFTLTHARGKDTQWVEYRGDEATACADAEKKYAVKGKVFGEWTVVA